MYCNMESRMSEFAIQVKHLDKMYKLYNKPSDRLKEALGFKVPVREHYALRDVSFEVRRGETVGIIGTNGSGKSTILKIITGVLNPTGGEVTVGPDVSQHFLSWEPVQYGIHRDRKRLSQRNHDGIFQRRN